MTPIALIIPVLARLAGDNEPYTAPSMLLPMILSVAIWMTTLAVLATLAYLVLALPLRRLERANVFLDVLEIGLQQGHTPESAIVQIASSRDRQLGYRLFLLASHLENGARLSEGLRLVPSLLPPEITEMLAVGERIGNIRKVLPACRRAASGGSSRVSSAVNYLVLMLMLNPFAAMVWPFVTAAIIPKFREIALDLIYQPLPPLLQFLTSHSRGVAATQIFLTALVYFVMLVYTCGPRAIPRAAPLLKPVSDTLNSHLSWRRKRLQRDFSAMLALLLDAGVPEAEAVGMAAESTANQFFVRRAGNVRAALAAGVPLTQAVHSLDDTGEFRWRLTNAMHGKGGFNAALAGWHESLDAQAYRQEQTVSQILTTTFVLINGVIVGLIAVGVFQVLTTTLQEMVLW